MANKKKIFWVEDEQGLIKVYTDALGENFELEFAKLAQTALDKVGEIQQGKAEKPSLIVIDLLLPDMNGIVVLQALKKSALTKDIPIVVLTNYGEEEAQEKLLKGLQVEKYLVKTKWPPNKLIPLIEDMLK